MARDYEVLDDMESNAADIMQSFGIAETIAKDAAGKLREHFRSHWGGQLVYFTKSHNLDERDIEIYEKWNGRNRDDLCREYNLSLGRLYAILKLGKALVVQKRQISLF